MTVVGLRVRPNEWQQRTSGTAEYTTDLNVGGMLEARILRSPYPNADIRQIDTSAAKRIEGVEAILTAADLEDRTYLHLGDPFRDRHALARERVRFVGEEVAAVAATSRAVADAALAAIRVRYRPHKAVFDPERARRRKAPLVHASTPNNIALQTVRAYGDPQAARSRAEVTKTSRYIYNAAAHLCLEPHSVVASWNDDQQRLDLWVSTQAPYFVRKEVAHMLGLDIDQVRTHPVAVGGGFGAKAKAGCHEVIAAALSIKAAKPVRLVLDRDEEFFATAIRHAFRVNITTGARRDGHLTHRDCEFVVDNGAYNHAGPSVAIYATMLAAGPYRFEGCESDASLVYTNKQPGASFRGYGNPQITFATESQIDEIADELGIDPLELRLRNAPSSGDVTLTGWRLGSARLDECLRRAADEIGWASKRPHAGTGRGVGLAAAIHVSGANAFEHSELSEAAVEVHDDGSVRVCFAGADAGTGQSTLLRQIAATELGASFDDVSIEMMDSHSAPQDLGAWSSRGTMWGGHATSDAARKAADALRREAAEKFSVDPAGVRLSGGHVRAGSDAVEIGDIVSLCEGADDGCLRVEGGYLTDVDKMDKVAGLGHFTPAYSFCVQAVEVDVDLGTGAVQVVDAVTVHDSGAALNPAAAEGQAIGAMAMGLGAALGEELVYEQGRLVNPSLLSYAAPRAADLPHIRAILLDSHDPAGPYGAKGIGEIGVVSTPAAVANAIAHATGVRVREVPITPDKILNGLKATGGALGSRHQRQSRLRLRRAVTRQQDHLQVQVPPTGLLSWRAFSPHRLSTNLIRKLYPHGLFAALHHYGTRWARWRGRAFALAPPPEVKSLQRPSTIEEAVTEHIGGSNPSKAKPASCSYIGGGTDLLVARDQRLVSPVHLVDTTAIREMRRINESRNGDLRIGASVTLSELRNWLSQSGRGPGDAMLAEVIASIASHQIRQVATVGGNLLQQKRCDYFRHGFDCYKRSGPTCPCYAVLGDHRFHHAVVGGHRCQAVTPSDLATGLLAVDSIVHTELGGSDRRKRLIDDLYSGPGESALSNGELLTTIEVPVRARNRRAAFEKLALYSGDFAVCSAAVSLQLEQDGVTIKNARIALGAVAPKPYQPRRSEKLLTGANINDQAALKAASQAWTIHSNPLPNNTWKTQAASALLHQALTRATTQQVGLTDP